MIAPTMALLLSLSPYLTPSEALSGISGCISMVCWIVITLPQLYLNYCNQDSEGLSIWFLLIWLFGDITNFVGAAWAGLVPIAVALAAWFCLGDLLLLVQCFYYTDWRARLKETKSNEWCPPNPEQAEATDTTEQTPLIGGNADRPRRKSDGPPGSFTRRSSVASASDNMLTSGFVEGQNEDEETHPWAMNTFKVVGVFVVGTAGWFVAYLGGAWKPLIEEGPQMPGDEIATGASILGYLSAAAYLCARIPQIYKDWKHKSTEGLAILFFILSMMGNLTYGLSILFHSQDKQYLIDNTPWLIGSFGTILQDAVIFVQFRMYSGQKRDTSAVV